MMSSPQSVASSAAAYSMGASPRSYKSSSTTSPPLSPSSSYLSDGSVSGRSQRGRPLSPASISNDDIENDEERRRIMSSPIDELKSDIDVYRQRGANMRALNLLEETAAGETHKKKQQPRLSPRATLTGTGSPGATTSLTTRQAAQREYEAKKKIKEQIKARLKQDQVTYRPPPKLLVDLPEKLAETTRRPRAKTAEDVRDPETVAGMKCKLDWDREKDAQMKALRLLKLNSHMMA